MPTLVLLACLLNPTTFHDCLVSHVQDSIVRVTGVKHLTSHFFGDIDREYVCSGFVIAKDRVLTADHCIGAQMLADGQPVTVLKQDDRADLALLRVSTSRPDLQLRQEPVKRFEDLTAIGYGWGWDTLTVLEGQAFLVNVPPPWREDEEVTTPGILTQMEYIGGMSGGPVIDGWGRVVGIVQRANEGVGYGVGTLIIRAFLVGTN